MNQLTEKQSNTATFLWTELHKSRTEIAEFMEIPNDKYLAFAIRGQMRQLAKSHVKLDSRLVDHHDSYPCPICFPRKSISRVQEDREWEAFRHSQSCLSNKLGMWVSRPRKETEVPKKSNDIVVVDEPMETPVLDISKLTKRAAEKLTTPAEKPLNKTDTTELLQMAKMGDNNPKVINELRTRFKGTKKQIDRKIRKAIKRLGKS